MAREVFLEAATLLYNGLAFDGLDEHDATAVVAGLCVDLVAADPGSAVRARSRAVLVALETCMIRKVRPRRSKSRRGSCSSEKRREPWSAGRTTMAS